MARKSNINRPDITEEKVAKAIQEMKGNISAIARKFGVSRGTIYNRIHDSEYLEELLQDERESMIDLAENKLLERIEAGDRTMIIFFLKTQAKDRGYVERQERTGGDGEPLEVQFVNDWREQ